MRIHSAGANVRRRVRARFARMNAGGRALVPFPGLGAVGPCIFQALEPLGRPFTSAKNHAGQPESRKIKTKKCLTEMTVCKKKAPINREGAR